MSIRTISIIAAVLFSSAAFGQSVITLDSVDLGADDQTSIMRDCLFTSDKSECNDKEYGGSTEITLDDVVNLGVIDRTAVPAAKPGTSASTDPLPSIDLEIQFAYNSDALSPAAYVKLSSLAEVMADPRMKNEQLVFIGHTDAIGSQAYNLELSQRRANAVARYVRDITGIAPDRIAAIGVGFSKLKNRYDPTAAENRRVQLVLVPIS